ncbi:hypothetical protein LSH36_770g01024, partial [Paralvinella palmiformis]
FGQTKFSEEFLSTLSGSAVLLWRTNPNLLRQNPAAHVMLGLLDRSRSLPRDLLFTGPISPSIDKKLLFYSYYKQAKFGKNPHDQPWAIQFEAKAKWEAWKKLGDMSKEEAMKLYVEEMYKVANGGYVIFCLRAQLIEWRSRMVSWFESVDSFAVLPTCDQPAEFSNLTDEEMKFAEPPVKDKIDVFLSLVSIIYIYRSLK